MRTFNKKIGQSILEYAILIGVVTAALTAMSLYVRRAIYANLKLLEDNVNQETMIVNSAGG